MRGDSPGKRDRRIKIAAHGNAGTDSKCANTSEKILRKRFRRAEQRLCSGDVGYCEKCAVSAAILDARREAASAFKQGCFRGSLFAGRPVQHSDAGKGIYLDLGHAAHHAERARPSIERADLLQGRFALHHRARTLTQFRPQAEQRLRGKLRCIEACVEFGGLAHRVPAQVV